MNNINNLKNDYRLESTLHRPSDNYHMYVFGKDESSYNLRRAFFQMFGGSNDSICINLSNHEETKTIGTLMETFNKNPDFIKNMDGVGSNRYRKLETVLNKVTVLESHEDLTTYCNHVSTIKELYSELMEKEKEINEKAKSLEHKEKYLANKEESICRQSENLEKGVESLKRMLSGLLEGDGLDDVMTLFRMLKHL